MVSTKEEIHLRSLRQISSFAECDNAIHRRHEPTRIAFEDLHTVMEGEDEQFVALISQPKLEDHPEGPERGFQLENQR